jgi:hypothetical protein
VTELERARENLLHHQTRLGLARNNGYSSEVVAYEADQFLAALSWVWDAQERALAAECHRLGTTGITWLGWDLAKEAGGGSFSSPHA